MTLKGPKLDTERELTAAFKTLKQKNLDLVFIILDLYSTSLYKVIKKLGDVDIGLCIVQSKFKNKRDLNQQQYFDNVLLKVNLKMGGENQCIDFETSLIPNHTEQWSSAWT
ncbi:hypothetical protein B0H63DRAFT_529618 [Podospora didyma]|uniref:Piwi domain-containing protein n=1 Tax=Podospora didyma TaxID=330526 RepID=A0AAE0K1J7_9PEZI|nr:hypothetical protein B0H63DRAFT_529618 [Podospora didyma]